MTRAVDTFYATPIGRGAIKFALREGVLEIRATKAVLFRNPEDAVQRRKENAAFPDRKPYQKPPRFPLVAALEFLDAAPAPFQKARMTPALSWLTAIHEGFELECGVDEAVHARKGKLSICEDVPVHGALSQERVAESEEKIEVAESNEDPKASTVESKGTLGEDAPIETIIAWQVERRTQSQRALFEDSWRGAKDVEFINRERLERAQKTIKGRLSTREVSDISRGGEDGEASVWPLESDLLSVHGASRLWRRLTQPCQENLAAAKNNDSRCSYPATVLAEIIRLDNPSLVDDSLFHNEPTTKFTAHSDATAASDDVKCDTVWPKGPGYTWGASDLDGDRPDVLSRWERIVSR